MSNLLTVRTIIQDTPLYQKDELVVMDGVQVTVQCKYFPVIDGTVIITDGAGAPVGIAFTLDEDNGFITFDTAPGEDLYTIVYKHVFLLDVAIDSLLTLNDNDDTASLVRLTAADCLDAIASSQALIQKKIKLLDLETDGPALAKALREHAKVLRDLVFSPDSAEASFDIIEQVNDVPGWREKITKDWMKELP